MIHQKHFHFLIIFRVVQALQSSEESGGNQKEK